MDGGPRPSTQTAGILLTGGRSRRMGTDKASMQIEGTASATRIVRILRRVVATVIEVGPGRSGVDFVREDPVGAGPLVAVSAGARALHEAGHTGPALAVACDLPLLTEEVLRMLVDHPGHFSVVPVVGDHPQPLCARWSAAALDQAARLVELGARSMKSLLDASDVTLLPEASWPEDVEASALADVNSPRDLEQLGLVWQPGVP